jgi:hypothetical protein
VPRRLFNPWSGTEVRPRGCWTPDVELRPGLDGAEVSEARKVTPSLEEVFVEVTGIEAGAMKQEKEKPKAGGGA